MLVLAMSTPVSGNHNDLFNIEKTFEELTTMLEDANISVDVLFMNADEGRFDTTLSSWMGFNFIAFIIMAIKKIKKSR